MKRIPFDPHSIPDVEGSIDLIFGGLGSGKTYAATADLIRDLQEGRVVYATWPVDFSGYDQRSGFWYNFLAFFGIKTRFFVFDKSNFHYMPLTAPDFMETFALSTDCVWYVDEAYAVIDSYVKNKMSLAQRFSIYGTRHFNRKLVLIAQRPTSIHVAARAMVNRFYQCERPLSGLQRFLHIALFVKTEYQDMIDENVDLEKPLTTTFYFGKARIFKAYNSKYLRGTASPLHSPKIDVYATNPFSLLVYRLRSKTSRERASARSQAPLSVPRPPIRSSFRITDINSSP